jgi:broad specificity phosphatase PhoE
MTRVIRGATYSRGGPQAWSGPGWRNRSILQAVPDARTLAGCRDYGSGVSINDPLPDYPAPDNPSGKLVLLRHGETEWSQKGRHTGLTDVPLTARGEDLARGAGRLVAGYNFSLVLTSPLQRAQRTAELAGLHAEIDPLLVEWDYGGYEGRTTRDIRSELGYNWSAFTHGVIRGRTPGETVEEVAARASRVLTRVLPAMTEGDVALVAHGHFLRILTAVFLRMAPRFGAQITLDAGSVSVLSFYREQPAILSWNYGLELPLVPSES